MCLSIANKLAVVDLTNGTVLQQINVGIAPWDIVLSPDQQTAYVSDWGGRFPTVGDLTAPSAGTQVIVDDRGVAASGALSVVNLANGTEIAKISTDLHPCDLELSADGTTLYIANANSDTVSVFATATRSVTETILVRPDPSFPYGSASTGLTLSRDGKTLFVASGGNNALAVIELPNSQHTNSLLRGFLPTDWYPGAVVADSNYVYVANVKGLGTRLGQPTTTAWQVGASLGTANRIPLPDSEALAKYTAQVFEDGRVRKSDKPSACCGRIGPRARAGARGRTLGLSPRRVCPQGKQDLRPDVRRPAPGQRQLESLHLSALGLPQSPRPRRTICPAR